MVQQRPPFLGRLLSKSLLCLLLLATLQVKLFNCQEVADSSASGGYTCTPDCPPGYECVYGLCEREQCTQNCAETDDSTLVCGSNGVTYDNLCELEKARCEQAKDIKLLYEGLCLTSSPAPEQLCRTEQELFDTNFPSKCISRDLYAKSENGSLTLSDALECFRPHCVSSTHLFQPKQCGYFFSDYCWCSSPDGYAIPNTFQRNMPRGFCGSLKEEKCEVDGIKYDHLEAYTPKDVCGRCECLNGNHSCFVEYTSNASGQLDAEQLKDLKKKLIQVYNFQHNHNEHVIVDIRHILEYPVEVTATQRKTVLDWKFSHYNLNEDFDLSPAEEFRFHGEIGQFFGEGCSPYYTQIKALMDANKNKKISMEEWYTFFDVEESATNTSTANQAQPAKREANLLSPISAKKPLRLRKKFRYVLH